MSSNIKLGQCVAGNYEDKYNTKNFISKLLVTGFLNRFEENLREVKSRRKIRKVVEIGTGEGELLKIVGKVFPDSALYGCDIDENEIQKARKNCREQDVCLSVQNAENLYKYGDKSFDLVVCCEVLEHLINPAIGIREIYRILKPRGYLIGSVPKEPLWRILNILRGKYWSRWGNTPGHLNHWGEKSFKSYIEEYGFAIINDRSPFPWTMVLAEK